MTDEGREEALLESPGGEEGGTPESGSDNAETLAKRLADTQKAFHESREELKAYRERMAKMEGQMEVITKGREAPHANQPDPFAEIDDDGYWADYFDSPTKARALTKKQIELTGGALFQMRKEIDAMKQALAKSEDEVRSLRSGLNKPDPALAKRIEALRQDPELAELPDDVLARLAKSKSVMPDEQYAGGLGGARRVTTRGTGSPYSREAQEYVKRQLAEAGIEEK
jgi:hypothetical protein